MDPMKIKFLFILSLAVYSVQAQEIALETNAKKAKKYAQTITESDLKTHLTTYASDKFEGRETGKKGQKLAVNYLKEQYVKRQISSAIGDDQYFQEFNLTIKKLPKGTLEIKGRSMENGDGFMAFNSIESHSSELAFVGYGVQTESYTDYLMDVSGKIVLIKAGEPKDDKRAYVVSGTKEASDWGKMSEGLELKLQLAQKLGAKAVIYYDEAYYDRYAKRFDYMKENNSGRMSIDALDSENIPVIYVDESVAESIYENISSDSNPKAINTSVKIAVTSTDEKVQTENVVAYIKGSEFPDEYVIISSHLDHIGISSNGDINNGADDDGSGTVSLLEIAEAFKLAADQGDGPKRSVVFLHVTGEEKGLLGSRYYTDASPVFPLNQTIANLNIDMVGRIDPNRNGDRNYVYLIGSDKLSTELHEISELVNDKFSKIELDYTYNDENDPNRFYYRSDHYNFAKNNIPIIFYFNGTHADYHKASDTVDKINFDLLENRSRLVFYTAWEVANRAKPIVADKATPKH